MYIASVFPKNPDGTLKRKIPCQTTGCKSPNWHICQKANTPDFQKVEFGRKKASMPLAQRLAISRAQKERHILRREAAAPRDNAIIKLYTEEKLAMHEVAKRMNLSQATVNKVLKRGQDEGVLTIRPKGFTLSRPGTN